MGKMTTPHAAPRTNWLVVLAYVGLVAAFLWAFGRFYLPGKGFTYLINFGSEHEGARLSQLREVDYYILRNSIGYDAQFYAQIALDPTLRNKDLPDAMDNLAYRARRILGPAVAYVMGLGRPAWILQAYALQNALSWLLLALISLRWFPPTGWGNLLRWAGVLFSLGLCFSVRNALLDGPSLLLIAVGVWLVEKNRPWLATVVLALAGLGKETNLLGSAALGPVRGAGWKGWGMAAVRGLLTLLPLALWMAYLAAHVGPSPRVEARNFALPFAAYGQAWQDTFRSLPNLSSGNLGSLANLTMLIALTVQFLYLVLRPQWQHAWWRVGASFALLMIILGSAVWEGEPSAASRVLLPMQFAFNVLVPAGRRWLPVLLLGNLTVFIGVIMYDPPLDEIYIVRGPPALSRDSAGRSVTVDYSPSWYGLERDPSNYWTWSSGDGVILIRNPHPESLLVRLRFSLSTNNSRTVIVRINGPEVLRNTLAGRDSVSANLRNVVLRPGENRIEFLTDTPAARVGDDPRQLAFCLLNLEIDLLHKQP